MLIRTEAPADILPIDHLLRSSFDSDQKANAVTALRENSWITLSLVACDARGIIVGYAVFTALQRDGEYQHWQNLSVLVVREEDQNKGIEKALVQDGLDMLYEFGYPVCTVFSHLELYRQIGFVPAGHIALNVGSSLTPESFLVFELIEGAATSHSGTVEFDYEVCPVL